MTDIDGRMKAWHGANIRPERASEYLKADFQKSPIGLVDLENGSRVMTSKDPRDKAKKYRNIVDFADAAKEGRGTDKIMLISPEGENTDIYFRKDPTKPIYVDGVPDMSNASVKTYTPDAIETARQAVDSAHKEAEENRETLRGLTGHSHAFRESADIAKSVLESDEADAMAENAAEEDAMDEFEAQGKKHMLDTKKERNRAVQPVVHADDKVRGAETVGRESKRLPQVAAWDANIDTSSYLEDLLSKGLITPEQYARARQAYMDGRTS